MNEIIALSGCDAAELKDVLHDIMMEVVVNNNNVDAMRKQVLVLNAVYQSL